MNSQHRKAKKSGEDDPEGQSKVPRVSMDYFFMSKADDEAKLNPILAMVDEATGERYTRAVGRKGVGTSGEVDWLIQDLVDEFKSWGHTGGTSGHIIIKSDSEPAIKALREAVGRLLGGRVIPEGPPKGESQSNGKIEESCKTIRGFTKVLKEQIETEAHIKLEGKDVITQWMLTWGAMLPSRFLIGKDGKTAYERRRGRSCAIPTERFGEKVWYKELHGKGDKQCKMDTD